MATQTSESTGSIGSTAIAAHSWKQLTVAEFLQTIAWTGQPPETVLSSGRGTAAADTPRISPAVLSYRLTVGQFFGAIPWQGGSVEAAALPLSLAVATADGEPLPAELPLLEDVVSGSPNGDADLTLDDFLDAFSGF